MKTKLTLIALLISAIVFAQSGINYKAILKDGTGNVIANQIVILQFAIKETSTTGTTIYEETHSPATNSFGLVIVTIGEGTPITGTFSEIDWATADHFLNVHINTGTGLVDMGTTQFNTVPYALNAANVKGLEALDEGNGIGWRLVGSEPANYGTIGHNAVDLSTSEINSSIAGAVGNYSRSFGFATSAGGAYSTAMGSYSTASAVSSTAMGSNNLASALGATVMGANNIASGSVSTAMGGYTEAPGVYSTSLGLGTRAQSYASTALGRFNLGIGSASGWGSSDPVFEIGIGTGVTTRANALTVLKNGTITAPSFDLSEITDPKALITKEYLDASINSGEQEIIIQSYDFNLGSNIVNYFNFPGNSYMVANSLGRIYIPFQVPIGATITGVNLLVYDNSTSRRIRTIIYRDLTAVGSGDSGSRTNITPAIYSTNSTGFQSLNFSLNETTVAGNSYFAYVYSTTNTGDTPDSWVGPETKMSKMIVSYTLPGN